MAFKQLLNSSEALTDERIRIVSERYGARVFAKARLADVLPIENSGIAVVEYGYALRAHFDFVVADEHSYPLFAVEFDGPHHRKRQAAERDALKNSLCARFDLPLLRINSRYLQAKYRGLDLLTWAIESWFALAWLNEAQAEGHIPWDEPIMPSMVTTLPGHSQAFPLWLSLDSRQRIRAAFDQNRCDDICPNIMVGADASGTFHAFAFLRMSDRLGITAKSAMHAQQFPIMESEMLGDIVAFEIADTLDQALQGANVCIPVARIYETLKQFEDRYQLRSYSGCGPRTRVNSVT